MRLLDVEEKPAPFTLKVPIRDSFHKAPGYREIGWLCQVIPDAMYPWDPDAVRRIREFVPDVVPLWVQWIFLSPADTGAPKVTVFGRHALGRSVEQRGWLPPFKVAMPSSWPGLRFRRPNLFWFLHEGENRDPRYRDLPGSYLPFDDTIVDRAWRSWAGGQNMTDKEYRELLRRDLLEPAERREKKKEKAEEERVRVWDEDVGPYVQRQLDQVSDVEREEYERSKVGATPTGESA